MRIEPLRLALVVGDQAGTADTGYPLDKLRDILDVVEDLTGDREIYRCRHIAETESKPVAGGKAGIRAAAARPPHGTSADIDPIQAVAEPRQVLRLMPLTAPDLEERVEPRKIRGNDPIRPGKARLLLLRG